MMQLAQVLRALILRAAMFFAAFIAVVALQGATTRGFAANWHGDYFPNVVLTDQNGNQHRFYDDVIKNKVVAVQFFFTSCTDVCPAETARLRQVYDILQKRMGHDVFIYSITIDPDRDDQKTLKAYSQRFKTGPGWTFLRGSKADVDLLQRKFGLRSGDLKQLRDHSTSIMFGNEKTARWTKRTANDDPVVLANLLGFQLPG
jgi:protein SCO1/2